MSRNLRALCSLYNYDRKLFDLTDLCGETPIDILIGQSGHLPRINYRSKNEGFTISTEGTLLTWGQNQNYTLGSSSESAKRYPEKVQIESNGKIIHTSFSKYHGMCLDSNGNIFSWGVQEQFSFNCKYFSIFKSL